MTWMSALVEGVVEASIADGHVVGERGRGRGRGRRNASTGRGRGRAGRGRGMGRGTGRRPVFGPLTEDQTTLEGPWERKESNALCWGYAGSAPGPASTVSTTVSALDLFCRFFVVGVWDLLVTETNRYAAQTMQNSTHAHPRPWTDIGVEEMKAFVGILMLMGICKLPRLTLSPSSFYRELKKL